MELVGNDPFGGWHMSRRILATLLLVALAAPAARAQFNFVGPGSTVQGDYLRGVGIAAFGMGVYNHQTAIANSINLDTEIRLNEYIYGSLMNENRMNAEHRAAMIQQNKENYSKIRERIMRRPEAHDVSKGDALNAVLEQLNNPRIQESSFRSETVPLSVDDVRRIPFKLGAKGVMRFSIARLTAKDKGKWPVAFQDPQFDRARRDFERALDNALELQYKGAMHLDAIQAVRKAVDNLEYKLEKVVGRIPDRLYFEARDRLKEMNETVEMLKTHAVEQALGELDRYAGTTVNDLRVFMRKHNLQFADAGNPEERDLYPELYAKLVAQREKVSVGLAVQDDEPKN
jgi:hypothetical protein